jgi:hypothetical protein
VQLLVVFEVDLMQDRADHLLEALEGGNEPLLAFVEVVDDLFFFLHL